MYQHDEDCDCWNCEGGIYIPIEEIELDTEVSEDLLDTLRELLEAPND